MRPGRAAFQDLRAAGAFLVSASWDGKTVSPVRLFSERGATARLANPWGDANVRVTRLPEQRAVDVRREGKIFLFATEAGAAYLVERG